ncbi:coiled-coil domain-containing protein 33-like isoform X3 [Mytilus edulis]|uniref:coiled-coil domain-containing protein 33-like isoform X3 n=1 Tax=Mytilus edulis TaxID=6550 RepID=UPI0039F04E12
MSLSVMDASTLPRVNDKALEFEVNIKDAQFNLEGKYFLRLSVQSLHTKDYSKIKIKESGVPYFENRYEGETDTVAQKESTAMVKFKEKQFVFRLPKGFCMNDKNHDVHLLVEAFTRPKIGAKGRKVGEGKFAIYPRPNAPRIKVNVEPGDDFYNYTDVMSLLRTVSTDSVQMHCGRIRCTYALREVLTVKPKSPPKTPPKSPVKKTVPKQKSPELREKDDKNRTNRLEPPPTNRTITPTDSWGGDNVSINVPATPPLPPQLEGRKIPEDPLQDKDRHSFEISKSYRHVSLKGKEQIDVILHGASNLPTTPDGQLPVPFGVVKSKTDDDKNVKTGASTHTSLRPTTAPSWEELVTVNFEEKSAADEVLTIIAADHPSKEMLVKYEIPLSYLQPFHQYHLELIKPVKGIPNGVKTYVTITRKTMHLPKDPSSPDYLALEATLRSVQKPLQTAKGPLIAVARVIPDYYNYKNNQLLTNPRSAGVTMNSVTFPNPHPSSFSVPPRSMHGYPQISLPGRPDVQPEWNHPYLFCEERDKATMFTPSAALVLEYYEASAAMSDQFWKMVSPVGFSAVPLDKDMYTELTNNRAKQGLRIDGVPIQGTEYVTIEGKQPTVGMILKLITTNNPDSMVSTSNVDNLPELNLFPEPQGYYRTASPDIMLITHTDDPTNTTMQDYSQDITVDSQVLMEPVREPVGPAYYLQKKVKRPMSPPTMYRVYDLPVDRYDENQPIKDGEMPPYEAVETVLPEYQYIFVDPNSQTGQRTTQTQSPTIRVRHQAPPADTTMPGAYGTSISERHRRPPDDLDKTSLSVMDHQMRELENYRSAVHKMGQDILALRAQIQELEGNNSQLRRDLANYNDASKLMIESAELDGMTKPEIMSRYAGLKQTLHSQTNDVKAYKMKVQALQNELIKKNDAQKNYLHMTHQFNKQKEQLLRMQEKSAKWKKVEETCRSQEKVIEKMEKVLERQHKDRSKNQKDHAGQEANEALLQENKHLRTQIDDLKDQLRGAGAQTNTGNDSDKFEMYQALEKSEARIASLERQLAENSRAWGKERADLMIRLNEADNGFGRANGMVLHDYPVHNDSLKTHRRNSPRLTPLYR